MLGGARKKAKINEAQKALLFAIWKSKGGVGAVANLLDVNIQAPVNWRNRGGVPLLLCLRIAEKLQIPVWGLNYKELTKFYGKSKAPEWSLVVKSYKLEEAEIAHILSLTPPLK